jgi:phenylacetate-CoA ligase
MDVRLLTEVLLMRAALRRRDEWSAERLAQHQQQALAALRRHAYARSPFYRRHHAGLTTARLEEIPPVTKSDLMGHWDEIVAVPGLRLSDLEAHLRLLTERGANPGVPWRHRWWAAATAGTTGRRGVFAWGRREWAAVLASYARATDWAGVPAGLTRPLRMAVVSSRNPTHQSAVVGASLASPLVPTLRLDATASLAEQVQALNGFRPRVLVGYPSALRPLAGAQLAGALRTSPQAVMSASEVLTRSAARTMTAAWGAAPYDVYAATETAGIASPCAFRTAHLYEDLLLVEPVDEAGRPVPAGTAGARLWVSVLFSRTLPLIRYEMSDRVALGGRGCPCGRSFRIVERVEGRTEDVLVMTAPGGTAPIHPNVFHDVLDSVAVSGWQVRQDSASALTVLLAGSAGGLSLEQLAAQIAAAVQASGATRPSVTAQVVTAIPRTALGKAPLVLAARSAPAPPG